MSFLKSCKKLEIKKNNLAFYAILVKGLIGPSTKYVAFDHRIGYYTNKFCQYLDVIIKKAMEKKEISGIINEI